MKGLIYTMTIGGLLFSSPVTWAYCKYNGGLSQTYHFLVNGLIHKPVPEVVFNIAGDSVGDGVSKISTTVNSAGGSKTLNNHVRFRLRQSQHYSYARKIKVVSSTPLSCVTCSSNITIPFSDFTWITNTSSSEHKGNYPSAGRFNNSTQTWISHGSGKQDSIFNLQFSFDNDVIYPAGTYQGTFQTQGKR